MYICEKVTGSTVYSANLVNPLNKLSGPYLSALATMVSARSVLVATVRRSFVRLS